MEECPAAKCFQEDTSICYSSTDHATQSASLSDLLSTIIFHITKTLSAYLYQHLTSNLGALWDASTSLQRHCFEGNGNATALRSMCGSVLAEFTSLPTAIHQQGIHDSHPRSNIWNISLLHKHTLNINMIHIQMLFTPGCTINYLLMIYQGTCNMEYRQCGYVPPWNESSKTDHLKIHLMRTWVVDLVKVHLYYHMHNVLMQTTYKYRYMDGLFNDFEIIKEMLGKNTNQGTLQLTIDIQNVISFCRVAVNICVKYMMAQGSPQEQCRL